MSGVSNQMNCTTKEMSEFENERWLMINDCIKGTWLEALRKVELTEFIIRPVVQELRKLAFSEFAFMRKTTQF